MAEVAVLQDEGDAVRAQRAARRSADDGDDVVLQQRMAQTLAGQFDLGGIGNEGMLGHQTILRMRCQHGCARF